MSGTATIPLSEYEGTKRRIKELEAALAAGGTVTIKFHNHYGPFSEQVTKSVRYSGENEAMQELTTKLTNAEAEVIKLSAEKLKLERELSHTKAAKRSPWWHFWAGKISIDT